ncbi:MAG: ADP compounds hydrolase NudE [Methylococcales bacterium]|nr:ADP compounds hydrolase NudE [Methylococcales bacterium]MCK5924580.1 ADP compounds hydrolase NudE [Methylococcales bacterium]
MPKKPVVSNRTLVHRSRLFTIESMDLTFSNGEKRNYECLKRGYNGGAVLIVPMLDEDTVLLIREYSAGVDRYELGLPKGKIDAGEAVLIAANRELKEEIGYGAKSLHALLPLTLAPGYFDHDINIIVAQDLYPEKLEGDEPEPLEVVPWKLSNIHGLLATGECTEARSIAALYMAREYLGR